jgi:hypothetical protein
LLSEDSDGLDSGDEESYDSSFESDERSGEGAKQNVNRFEIHTNPNLLCMGTY